MLHVGPMTYEVPETRWCSYQLGLAFIPRSWNETVFLSVLRLILHKVLITAHGANLAMSNELNVAGTKKPSSRW